MYLHISLIVFALSWKPCDPAYVNVETMNRLKQKIFHMEMELVKDVIMKIKAVNPFRDMYYKSVVYQAGQLMFFVKMRMDRMNYLYTVQHSNITNNAGSLTWVTWDIKKSVGNLLEVNKIAMELDVLIEAMEDYNIKREDKSAVKDRMKYLRSGLHEDNAIPEMRAYHAKLEKATGKGARRGTRKRKNKTGKWHYGGDDGIGSLVKDMQKSALK